MFDTGWKLPTIASSDNNLGANQWSNTNNILLQDGLTAGWTGSKFTGNDPEDGPSLKAYGYGFNLPPAAIILGIETRIYGSGTHIGESAYLTIQGSPVIIPYGVEKKDYWSRISSPFIYGSPEDLWGTGDLTPEIVNDSSFGWTYMIYDSSNPLSSAIDCMQMKIYYEVPEAAGMMGAGF